MADFSQIKNLDVASNPRLDGPMGDFESAVSGRFGDYPPWSPIQEAFAAHMVFRARPYFPPDYLIEETLSSRGGP
jgi:hypothetical protein